MPHRWFCATAMTAVMVASLIACGDVPTRARSLPAGEHAASLAPPPGAGEPNGLAARRFPRHPRLPFDTLRLLKLDTYESSGQVVHPDVATVSTPWGGERFFLAITPYPRGDARFENPSIFESLDGVHWAPPRGGANPVVVPAGEGYLSDPSLMYNPADGLLWMYFREATPVNLPRRELSARNIIALVTSQDGVAWSAPRAVITAHAHTLVSPSVVRTPAGDWYMWSVDGGTDGCSDKHAHLDLRRSLDGLTWSAPKRADLKLPNGGLPWHVAVQWIPTRGEFWMIYNLKVPGSCATPAVYLATSTDGIQWRHLPTPVLERGALPAFRDIVYRSSLQYDATDDAITFYYSGARAEDTGLVWSAAVQRRRRGALFARLRQVPGALKAVVRGLPLPEVEP